MEGREQRNAASRHNEKKTTVATMAMVLSHSDDATTIIADIKSVFFHSVTRHPYEFLFSAPLASLTPSSPTRSFIYPRPSFVSTMLFLSRTIPSLDADRNIGLLHRKKLREL